MSDRPIPTAMYLCAYCHDMLARHDDITYHPASNLFWIEDEGEWHCTDCTNEPDEAVSLADEVKRLIAESSSASIETKSLALSLWQRHYKEASPDFELLDSTAGVISQINNMAAGLGNEIERLNAHIASLPLLSCHQCSSIPNNHNQSNAQGNKQ